MNDTIKTMVDQFGGSKALYMIGAKNCGYNNKENSFSFKFMRNSSQAIICKLQYHAGPDTYSMTFYTRALREVKRFDDVYCDELARTFSEYTGLVLRMPRIIGINA
ncbi:MAG: hypothetical protein WCX79_03770 [Candidatus Paceibacterota bacterium]|jgi:hypothetical protein